jgi:hypothetical protein
LEDKLMVMACDVKRIILDTAYVTNIIINTKFTGRKSAPG